MKVYTEHVPLCTFTCTECGGCVETLVGPNRLHEYTPGIFLSVPEDFPIPACIECKEEYMSLERAEALDALLKQVFMQQGSL